MSYNGASICPRACPAETVSHSSETPKSFPDPLDRVVVTMPRRRGGLKHLLKQKAEREKALKAGEKLQAEKLEHVEKVVADFKVSARGTEARAPFADAPRLTRFSRESSQNNLEQFAMKHREEINRDPEFRRDFQVMCQNIGVDPLSSSKVRRDRLVSVARSSSSSSRLVRARAGILGRSFGSQRFLL